MSSDEFQEFKDNDMELLVDEEWDEFSLSNGILFYYFKIMIHNFKLKN